MLDNCRFINPCFSFYKVSISWVMSKNVYVPALETTRLLFLSSSRVKIRFSLLLETPAIWDKTSWFSDWGAREFISQKFGNVLAMCRRCWKIRKPAVFGVIAWEPREPHWRVLTYVPYFERNSWTVSRIQGNSNPLSSTRYFHISSNLAQIKSPRSPIGCLRKTFLSHTSSKSSAVIMWKNTSLATVRVIAFP